MKSGCPRAWTVDAYRDRRLGESDAASFERHLGVCTECRVQLERDDALRELARALPDRGPGDLESRRTRAKIVRDLATSVPSAAGPRRRTRVTTTLLLAVVMSLACAGGWAFAVRQPVPALASAPSVPTGAPPNTGSAGSPSYAGTVDAVSESRWTQSRDGTIERVTIERGRVRLHVRHQAPGERFLVAIPDGEIEVRGTTFEVTVESGVTTSVHVDDGVVELRLHQEPTIRLEAGDLWRAADPPAAASPVATLSPSGFAAPISAPGSTGRSLPTAAPAHDARREESTAYEAAMEMLAAGRNTEAATGFQAFLLAHPGARQAEDASYLEAVALARAGRADAAALAAEQHLTRFPSSFHRKEAALLVARAATLRGDCVRARNVLAEWTRGSDADARSVLQACQDR
jgi:hypothetical protein